MKFKRGTWFLSDTHFFHNGILKFTDRPYTNVQDMNEGILNTWNSMIRPEHTVYILGDLQWSTGDYSFLKRLNGHKYLIFGNHDADRVKFLKNGISLVCEEMIIKIGGERVRLSHYPYRYKGFKQFYYTCKNYLRKWFRGGRLPNLSNNPRDDGKYLLHGHHHNPESHINGHQFNVCWDLWKRPVNIQEIESWIQRSK